MAVDTVESMERTPLPITEEISYRVDTPATRMVRRFRRHKLAMIGLAIVILLIVVAIAAPLVARHDPLKTDLSESLEGPSGKHWLGTDVSGRDVWARVVFASRVSLSVGIVAVGISLLITLLLGTLAGYYGGVMDMSVMRITDMIMAIPSLVLIMIVVSLIGPSIYNVMLVIGVLGWPGTTRLLRGQILSVRERDFVMAARCIGVRDRHIMIRHVLPSSIAPLVVSATLGVAGTILTEASLSFLGFGVLPPTPSWGNMLNAARSITRLTQNPWFWVPPGVAILITVLAINFVGDGLQGALNPRHGDI